MGEDCTLPTHTQSLTALKSLYKQNTDFNKSVPAQTCVFLPATKHHTDYLETCPPFPCLLAEQNMIYILFAGASSKMLNYK